MARPLPEYRMHNGSHRLPCPHTTRLAQAGSLSRQTQPSEIRLIRIGITDSAFNVMAPTSRK